MGLEDTYHISRIVIDPKDPDVVYVSAIGHNYTYNKERGVFRDEGWRKNLEKNTVHIREDRGD